MTFDELSDEAKMCFIVYVTELVMHKRDWCQFYIAYGQTGAPHATSDQARLDVLRFITHSYDAGRDEAKRKAKERRKIASKIRI